MKIYDVSVDLYPRMQIYPGDPRFRSKLIHSVEKGDSFTLSKIMMSNHAGTHIDAPAHMIPGGQTITELSLEAMNGRVRVVHIRHREKIDVPDLKQLVLMDDFRILFKTRNSLLWSKHKNFSKKYIYLTAEAAQHLVDRGIKLVGFDYLSIDKPNDPDFPAHKILLRNQVILVECLNLSEVDDGEYEMSCLPLRLKGLDAAPARVMLRG
jgi:arylformamidase